MWLAGRQFLEESQRKRTQHHRFQNHCCCSGFLRFLGWFPVSHFPFPSCSFLIPLFCSEIRCVASCFPWLCVPDSHFYFWNPLFCFLFPRFTSEILCFAFCFPGLLLKSFVSLPVSPAVLLRNHVFCFLFPRFCSGIRCFVFCFPESGLIHANSTWFMSIQHNSSQADSGQPIQVKSTKSIRSKQTKCQR